MNIIKLEDKLEKLPSEIYTAEKEVIKAREQLDMAKADLEIATAKALLLSNKPNATEKKADATVKTEAQRRELTEKQIEYDKFNSFAEAQRNHYISLRKIASIEVELIKSKLSGN